MKRYILRLFLTFVHFASLCFFTAYAAVMLTERLKGAAYLASMAVLVMAALLAWRWTSDQINEVVPNDAP